MIAFRAVAERFEAAFAAVRPVPFLDDTTTKNVIIDGGRLTGIVDVDEVCFGDPLLTPALTQMALLASGHDTDYVDFWCDAMDLTQSRRRVLTFYTALFCVNFLAEVGQKFNADISAPVDHRQVARLTTILEELLGSFAVR